MTPANQSRRSGTAQPSLAGCISSTAREYAEAGGLMAYGPNVPDNLRRAARYVARILKGEKAGDLPVEQPVKFEMVINLKTAKASGLDLAATEKPRRRAAEQRDELAAPQCDLHAILTVLEAAYPMGAGSSAGLKSINAGGSG
jgi:hypothetical protein